MFVFFSFLQEPIVQCSRAPWAVFRHSFCSIANYKVLTCTSNCIHRHTGWDFCWTLLLYKTVLLLSWAWFDLNCNAGIDFRYWVYCRNLLVGDTLSGCWATVGVLSEKGTPKTSSTGKTYSIWKVGSLDENTVSLFLFGDAYQRNCKEQAGTVFALFNCAVRKDAMVLTCHVSRELCLPRLTNISQLSFCWCRVKVFLWVCTLLVKYWRLVLHLIVEFAREKGRMGCLVH